LVSSTCITIVFPHLLFLIPLFQESYWIKQYRPELLPQTESHDSHAAPQTEDEKLMTETVARLKKIEAALGIEN
jgi:hypothetical protein